MWTLATPFVDKPYAIPVYLRSLKALDLPRRDFKLLWLDMTKNPQMTHLLKSYLDEYAGEWGEVEYVENPQKKFGIHIPDNYYRAAPEIARLRLDSVSETMNIINSRRKGHLLLWEDDIFAPKDAWQKLKSVFDASENIWGATGVQYSRNLHYPNQIQVWRYQGEFKRLKDDEEKAEGVEAVGAASNGFVLYRDVFLETHQFSKAILWGERPLTGPDLMCGYHINQFDIYPHGGTRKLMLRWDVKLPHLGDDGEGRLRIFKSPLCPALSPEMMR